MKKMFRLAAIAAISTLTLAACHNNKPAEEEVEPATIEQVAEEEMIAEPAEVLDSTPVVEEQKAEPAKKVSAKPAAKKEEPKVDETKQVNKANEGSAIKATPVQGPVKRTRN